MDEFHFVVKFRVAQFLCSFYICPKYVDSVQAG